MIRLSETPMGQVVWNDGFIVAPVRVESPLPNLYRQAQYPDGRIEIQAAYSWCQGHEGGIVWRALPLVQVGEDGQELPA